MDANTYKKITMYQLTVIFSVLFSLAGFSYNVWRMEVTEENNNIRTACFEMLMNLSSLEQLIYTAHYDGDLKEGSPRKGWVVVGLIVDLSALTDNATEQQAVALKKTWAENWDSIDSSRKAVDTVENAIDASREQIKRLLRELE